MWLLTLLLVSLPLFSLPVFLLWRSTDRLTHCPRPFSFYWTLPTTMAATVAFPRQYMLFLARELGCLAVG